METWRSRMLDVLKKKLLLQDWLNNVDEPRKLRGSVEKISAGDRIFFRTVEQPEISNKECVVGAPVIYHFASTQLTSFPLFDLEFNLLCHMIVAKVKGANPYLALSKKVNPVHYKNLCTDDDFQQLVQAKYPDHLYVRKHGANMQNWMHFHYSCSIKDATGTKIFSENDVKSFSYSLYVAKDEHKALELERYPNGHFSMYATVFVPLKYVQEIKHVRTSSLSPTFSSRLKVPKDVFVDELPEPKIPSEPTLDSTKELLNDTLQKEPDENSSAQIFSLPSARNVMISGALPTATMMQPTDALSTAMQQADKKEQAQQVQPAAATTPAAQEKKTAMPCNLHMASKLIDEAIRNEMRVTDVIRKALGLETVVKDHIHFDLQLSNRDYEVLADRFDVPISDKETIHRLMMEEIGDFVGEPVDID